MVTRGDGEIVTVPDAHPEGVSYPVVGRELNVTVRLPDVDWVEEVLGDGETVGVSMAVVGRGVRDIVKLPEGDPVEV